MNQDALQQITNIIVANLRRARLFVGLTQQELAKAAGTRYTTYRSWETCQVCPKVSDLIKLAKALGCTLGDLVTEERILKEVRWD